MYELKKQKNWKIVYKEWEDNPLIEAANVQYCDIVSGFDIQLYTYIYFGLITLREAGTGFIHLRRIWVKY